MSAIDVDQTQGECIVYSYKEGLLSAVAHDLKIRVGRWKLSVSEDRSSVRATFEASSLKVLCVMRDGQPDLSAPSDRDRRTIEEHLLDDVLEAKRYPKIELDAKVDAQLKVTGTLTLHGVSRPISTTLRQQGSRYSAAVELHQPDFRIKPFTAMLGTLKVKPNVRVELKTRNPPI